MLFYKELRIDPYCTADRCNISVQEVSGKFYEAIIPGNFAYHALSLLDDGSEAFKNAVIRRIYFCLVSNHVVIEYKDIDII